MWHGACGAQAHAASDPGAVSDTLCAVCIGSMFGQTITGEVLGIVNATHQFDGKASRVPRGAAMHERGRRCRAERCSPAGLLHTRPRACPCLRASSHARTSSHPRLRVHTTSLHVRVTPSARTRHAPAGMADFQYMMPPETTPEVPPVASDTPDPAAFFDAVTDLRIPAPLFSREQKPQHYGYVPMHTCWAFAVVTTTTGQARACANAQHAPRLRHV